MNKLPNIEFRKKKKNPTLDSDTSFFTIPFYKDMEYFSSLDNFVFFVKAVERLVRTSDTYKKYISYLKNDLGMNFCQVLPNVNNNDAKKKTVIEMHHGPILTLFDYASIMTDYYLAKNKNVTSYIIANTLLEEHFENRIQVVMLSKTIHEEVHAGNVFLNLNQGFGDLNGFINKYHDGLSSEIITKINNYIERSEKYDSFDKDVLKLQKTIEKWS